MSVFRFSRFISFQLAITLWTLSGLSIIFSPVPSTTPHPPFPLRQHRAWAFPEKCASTSCPFLPVHTCTFLSSTIPTPDCSHGRCFPTLKPALPLPSPAQRYYLCTFYISPWFSYNKRNLLQTALDIQ